MNESKEMQECMKEIKKLKTTIRFMSVGLLLLTINVFCIVLNR